jgi:DNA-binding NtrC family response regulator
MKKPPMISANLSGNVTVLVVDPSEEDHASLVPIFGSYPWGLCPDFSWTLKTTTSIRSAWRILRAGRVPIVLCEYDLGTATWRELLEPLASLEEPPFLIVTSRLADERLWAEALNLGAYDVLAKPFDRTEVMRVVSLAWLHWRERYEAVAPTPRLAAAAGYRGAA